MQEAIDARSSRLTGAGDRAADEGVVPVAGATPVARLVTMLKNPVMPTRTTLMRIASLSLLVVAALACSASTAYGPSSRLDVISVSLGEPFDLAVGQSAVVGATGLRVGFQRVEGDSRCAVDVTCVWEGDAEVALPVERAGQRAVAHLHTTLEPRKLEYAGYDIELVALRPENHSAQPIPAANYVATLRVTSR